MLLLDIIPLLFVGLLFFLLFPFGIHFLRKLHNLPAQLHKVDCMLLQFVEQRHRLLFREVDAQLFDDLIVVRADGTELGMEIGQLGTVFQHCLIHLQYLELLTEEMRLEKDGFRIHL